MGVVVFIYFGELILAWELPVASESWLARGVDKVLRLGRPTVGDKPKAGELILDKDPGFTLPPPLEWCVTA